MAKIIKFPVKHGGELNKIVLVIKKMLEGDGATEDCVNTITRRMSEFLKLCSFSLPINFEMSGDWQKEFFEKRIKPEIKKMRYVLNEHMNDLIIERLNREIEVYSLEVDSDS
jgi:hypothetical protein